MPRVRWGDEEELLEAGENWDPDEQIQPYDGPTPPTGLYHFDVKVLKKRQGKNFPQLMIGLELVPRKGRSDDKKYVRYFIMDFAPVSPQTNFRWMPFVQAIGVSPSDLIKKCVTDEDGNVTKIGRWVKREKGNVIAVNIVHDPDDERYGGRKVASYFAPKSTKAAPVEEEEEEYEEEEYEEEPEEEEYEEEDAEEEYEEEEEEEEEPPPPPRRPAKKAAKKAPAKKAAKKAAPAARRRKAAPEPEEDDEPPF